MLSDGKQHGATLGRAVRVLGTVFIVVGLLFIVWAGVIWRYGDPITGAWYRFEQHRLETRYNSRAAMFTQLLSPEGAFQRTPAQVPHTIARSELRSRLARAAGAYRLSLAPGDPVGRIVVPRLSLNTILVDGTDTSDLRRGPGLDEDTSLPGRGHLVYIAGHRTTFGAPFAAIDRLKVGDPIELRLPYATFRYAVIGHRIVRADDVTVLSDHGHEQLLLQACHPRFFATHRYLVDAKLVAVVFPAGSPSHVTSVAVGS